MMQGKGPKTHASAFFEGTLLGWRAHISLFGQRDHGAAHSTSSDDGQKPPVQTRLLTKESGLRLSSQVLIDITRSSRSQR